MWDETARLDTVSPAGQMEAAEDDILPAVPELNIPPRHIKKYFHFGCNKINSDKIHEQRRHCQLSELRALSDATGLGRRCFYLQPLPVV